MITGRTQIIAHIGVPTESFKAPMIYNPWFDHADIDCIVVPMGCEAENFDAFLPLVMALKNCVGALVTMPHKVAVTTLLDEASAAVKVCGACNAVKRDGDGRLIGDMFDGAGFVRGMERKGRKALGASALVVGAGGVGSGIAASLAEAGVSHLAVFDAQDAQAAKLATRLKAHFPKLVVETSTNDPYNFDIVVNATPLGMDDDDPLPFDVARLQSTSFVGEVVMTREVTPMLFAARDRGCATQIGTDMLYEQIPAYLEFFGLPSTNAENLRSLSKIPN